MQDRIPDKGIEDYIKSIPDNRKKESPIKLERVDHPDDSFRRDENADLSLVMDSKPKRNIKFTEEITTTKKVIVTSSGPAYGIKKRPGKGDEEYIIADRCYDLEKENLTLKEKENLLEREILKQIKYFSTHYFRMQTKLRRIEELTKSKNTFSDKDFARIQKELEDQYSEILDENSVLADRIRKLKIIHVGLKNKKIGAKQITTHHTYYNVTKRKTSHTRARAQPTQQNHALLEELKIQMVKNEKEILKLTSEKDKYINMTTGRVTTDELLRKIREREEEVHDISREFDEMNRKFIHKETLFKESKAYIDQILNEIGIQKKLNQELSMKNNRVQIQASQARSLKEQLDDLLQEKKETEDQIRRITSEPFLNREKGQSVLKRQAELRDKIAEKEKILKARREEEYKRKKDLEELRPNVEKLRGEKEYLEKESKRLKEKYKDSNTDEYNVYSTLFKLDPKKYAETIKDFTGKPEQYPIWKDMQFLERPNEHIDIKNAKEMKLEIAKLRHENKDFAAELEKAQHLFKLQKDIQKDNQIYFEQERDRLIFMLTSTQAKSEELARKADEKRDQIEQVQKKMGLTQSRSPSPIKGADTFKNKTDQYETQSEFSVMTNESEIKNTENILDFVVQDAEYNYEAFRQVLDDKEMMLLQKTLITFVTVDFYNHDTETSQIAEGYRPIYNTQFSFKNKIDDFYVQFLQKNIIKVDVYISKNNAAIHLGRAEIHLRELIERENIMQELSMKPPVIQQRVRIFPASGMSEQPIGNLKIKMRMRKHLSEIVRHFRTQLDVQNELAGQDTLLQSGVDMRNRKKLITIQIVKCENLRVKYSNIAQIQPFFYYQFYNQDERYSMTGAGKDPNYEDTQNYEVQFDAKLIQYLQKEELEVILFDDAAPVTGVERGGKAFGEGEQVDDMIGSCKIPLGDLVKGSSINDKFSIRNLKKEEVGKLIAKISIIDIDAGFATLASKQLQQQAANLHYNKLWENEFVYRIAKKIAKFPGDLELLFGIFTRGQKNVTKEDFKYTCLKRLNLKNDISEREIDMFLRGNQYLVDKNLVELDDFVQIFTEAITRARSDFQNEIAIQQSAIRQYEQRPSQTGPNRTFMGGVGDVDPFSSQNTLSKDQLERSRTSLHFSEQEILEILARTRFGNTTMMRNNISNFAKNNYIAALDLIRILAQDGNLGDFDAKRVVNAIEQQGAVSVSLFEDLLSRALQQIYSNSEVFKRFLALVQTDRVEYLMQQFKDRDFNKDGNLDKNGFSATLLNHQFGFKPDECIELFSIVQRENVFHYRDFIAQYNPSYKFRISRTTTPGIIRTDTPLTTGLQNNPSGYMNESISEANTISMQNLAMNEDPNLSKLFIIKQHIIGIIKNKLKNYIQQQDFTLNSLFQIIDTNSDMNLTMNEFIQKLKAIRIDLEDIQLQNLFQILDKTNKGSISFKQFLNAFPEINIEAILRKIKRIISSTGFTYDQTFNQYVANKVHGLMSLAEFKNFIRKYIPKITEDEIAQLFSHFGQGKDQLTLDDFKAGFGKEVRDQVFKINIEDIIKPLATRAFKYGVNINELFVKYDENKNQRLSAEELATALRKDFSYIMMDDEIQTIKEYFLNKFKSYEIFKQDFFDLLSTKFDNTSDQTEATESMKLLRIKFAQITNKTPSQLLNQFNFEKAQSLTLRNFKVAINSIKALSDSQLNNLAKFLDRNGEGYISIAEFERQINAIPLPLNSSSSFDKSTGRRNQRWKDQDLKKH
ncbi:protein fantom [Stylonychia lemnae]|uniref:Protein fantom n=1 Tax=Stylonychia lemnae TaxID=5949 RepID=A0A078AWM1_STYLE|nr:protein fantom [Stylonychia lemnae]|eukprot:CDW85652.1 protein fantom [Stylonychia lemnae]